MRKYIIVCGGVMSGCGKGVAAASVALLLKMRGCNVNMVKFDPYLSANAGLLAPREHGEVFLCDDGTECDLDLGHYQRLAGIELSKDNIYTSGTLHKELIHRQEHGENLGQSLQIIPHLTNLIIEKIENLDGDITIVEVGGTVGDLESGAYYEAIAQAKRQMNNDCLVLMVAPILWVNTISEFKTKPLQRSVRDLQSYGINPDILLCRVERPVPEKVLDKVSQFCGISREAVFDAPDVQTIYQVPIEFYNRHLDDLIADKFHLRRSGCKIHKYRQFVEKYLEEDKEEITIGIFGKYDNCDEAYISLKEALYHAGLANNVRVKIKWIIAEELEAFKGMRNVHKYFEGLDGIIIPGGFDKRGVEGKIKAIRYAREKKIPFLGICLGLQCAVIEFARNVCNLDNANSLEFEEETTDPVIHFVEGQEELTKKCGTMRLGAYKCELAKQSLAHELYNKRTVSERHRHRYEVNDNYVAQLEKGGLRVSGRNPETGLVEMMELNRSEHPFFIGTQAHPEFRSKLLEPAPLFNGLVQAAKSETKEEG